MLLIVLCVVDGDSEATPSLGKSIIYGWTTMNEWLEKHSILMSWLHLAFSNYHSTCISCYCTSFHLSLKTCWGPQAPTENAGILIRFSFLWKNYYFNFTIEWFLAFCQIHFVCRYYIRTYINTMFLESQDSIITNCGIYGSDHTVGK